MTDEQKQKPKTARKMTKAEQSERFIKTARELGVDETGEEFERMFRKIVPSNRGPLDGALATDKAPQPDNRHAKRTATKRRLKDKDQPASPKEPL